MEVPTTAGEEKSIMSPAIPTHLSARNFTLSRLMTVSVGLKPVCVPFRWNIGQSAAELGSVRIAETINAIAMERIWGPPADAVELWSLPKAATSLVNEWGVFVTKTSN